MKCACESLAPEWNKGEIFHNAAEDRTWIGGRGHDYSQPFLLSREFRFPREWRVLWESPTWSLSLCHLG